MNSIFNMFCMDSMANCFSFMGKKKNNNEGQNLGTKSDSDDELELKSSNLSLSN